MNPNLVRPPGIETNGEERMSRQQLLDVEMRYGVARRVRIQGSPHRIVPVAPDRRFDPPAPRARPACNEGQIAPLELPSAHEILQPLVRFLRAGNHEQARCVAVQPVDDPRPVRKFTSRDPPVEERVDERAALMTRGWMHDEPRRLVDDEQVLVVVGNSKLSLLRLQCRFRPLARRDLDGLAALETVTFRDTFAVYKDSAFGEQSLGLAAGAHLLQRSDKAVDPLSRSGGRNPNAYRGRVSPARIARKRIPTPTTMNVSARLNAGQ